jgi:hypothetical protein
MTDMRIRDARLDTIKAVAITLAILWHLQPIQFIITEKTGLFTRLLQFETTLFFTQISLTAVPLFFITSLYLFFNKMEIVSFSYIKKRYQRLLELFVFWTSFQFLLFYIVPYFLYIIGFENVSLHPQINSGIWSLIMNGGPQLPLVGESVFYYLFVLLILTGISFFMYTLKKFKSTLTVFSIVCITLNLSYFEYLNCNGLLIHYWDIRNFLIYIPISYLIYSNNTEKLIRYIPILFFLYFLFSAQDLFLQFNGGYLLENKLSIYARVSIVCGALAIFCSLFQINKIKTNNTIVFISKFSLGIFALHKYIQLFIIILFMKVNGLSVLEENWPIAIEKLLIGTFTIITALLIVSLCGRTRFKRFLS